METMKKYASARLFDQKKGDTFQPYEFIVRTRTDVPVPVDLTDLQIIATFRVNSRDGKVIHVATIDEGITIDDPTSGRFILNPWKLNIQPCVVLVDIRFIGSDLIDTPIELSFNVSGNTNPIIP
jgi:hypothetical protein